MDIFNLLGKNHYNLIAENKTYREAFNPEAGDWTEEQEQKFLAYVAQLNKGNN